MRFELELKQRRGGFVRFLRHAAASRGDGSFRWLIRCRLMRIFPREALLKFVPRGSIKCGRGFGSCVGQSSFRRSEVRGFVNSPAEQLVFARLSGDKCFFGMGRPRGEPIEVI